MTDKIPEALAVLDRLTDYIDPDGHTYSFNEVERVRQARSALSELIEAVRAYHAELKKPIGVGTYAQVVSRVDCALAAVEELP